MRQIFHLIFLFAIYRTVYSSPVPANATKSRVELPLLAVLLTFVSVLFVLFCTKWLYITRRRQARKESKDGNLHTSQGSGLYVNLSTSPSPGDVFLGSDDLKSGFFIGLLGSPTWETRHSAIIVDRRSLQWSSRKSVSGLTLASQGSKSCQSSYRGASRTPGLEEHTSFANDAKPMSLPSPAVAINRSPLLSDHDCMRLSNGRLSYGTTMNSSLYSPCIKDLGPACVPNVSHLSFFTNSTSAAGVQTPFTMCKPTNGVFLGDTSATVQSSSMERDNQKPFAPSVRSKTMHPTKYIGSPHPIRNYHSPEIGLSPLRPVVLPPVSCPHPCRPISYHSHQPNPPTHPLESSVLDPNNTQFSSTQTPNWKKNTETDSLLDLMAELAQETSAWDPDVFMEEKFKNLIAQSRPQTVLKATLRGHNWKSSRHRKVHQVFTTLEDIPEVDGKFN